MDDITESDAAVCYFVSWYIARSVARRRRCSCCKNMLIERNEISMITIPEQYTELYNISDRGGMSAPTEICFWYRCNWNAVFTNNYIRRSKTETAVLIPTIDFSFYV